MNRLDVMRARQFAIEKHDGQMYGNLPYLYHLDMVHQLAEGIGFSEIHQVVAYLHDTIEDGVSDYTEISKEFGSEIAKYVSYIGRDKDNETYTTYIERIKYYGGVIREVKVCDLLCNLEECIKNPTGKNASRIVRYKKALVLLGGS